MDVNQSASRLKALADPTRLRLLTLLEKEELTVRDLTEILGMAQSRVSGHLAVLRDAGLVQDRREGTSAYYSPVHGSARSTWEAVRETLAEESFSKDAIRLEVLLQSRKERSREFFDRVSDTLGTRSESLGARAATACLAGLVPRDMTVLDLGTGTGSLVPVLAGKVSRVVAVDSSRGMVARAAKRAHESNVQVDLVRGDIAQLPFPNSAVDGVVANMVLHHVPSPEAVFREMARVLKPGGRAVVVDFETHEESWLVQEEGHRWAGFDGAQLGAWGLDAGFSIPDLSRVTTPEKGRWSQLEVFAARFVRR